MGERGTDHLDRLRTLPAEDPTVVRREVGRTLMEAVHGDFAVFFTLVPDEVVEYRYAAVTTAGPAEARLICEGIEHRPFDSIDSWRPDAPPPAEVGRFVSLWRTRDRETLERYPSYWRYYRPLGVVDQVRMLAYRGDSLVGWIGVLRSGSRRPFGTHELRRLGRLASPVIAALDGCDTRARLDERDGPATILLRPDGSVDYATAAGRQWLARGVGERLRWWVRRLDVGCDTSWDGLLGTDRVRLVRLDRGGAAGVRYLATVERAPIPRSAPWARLPARQREVAQLAAAGATAPEIARSMGTSAETVRSQLKTVYRALGVGSRAELAAAMAARGHGSD